MREDARMIEMGARVPGPAAGVVLADWGADGAEPEPPGGGRLRHFAAPRPRRGGRLIR